MKIQSLQGKQVVHNKSVHCNMLVLCARQIPFPMQRGEKRVDDLYQVYSSWSKRWELSALSLTHSGSIVKDIWRGPMFVLIDSFISFQLVLPEYAIHIFLTLVFLFGGQWMAVMFNIPLLAYHIHRYVYMCHNLHAHIIWRADLIDANIKSYYMAR